jgi:uncharacterized protein YaaW (UPF0174 family)
VSNLAGALADAVARQVVGQSIFNRAARNLAAANAEVVAALSAAQAGIEAAEAALATSFCAFRSS